jgi:DNA-binding response OmpR family regulator
MVRAMKPRLILVACAAANLPSLADNLAASGCRVQFAASGMDLLKKARRRVPDLIILSASLPDLDVTTVCDILSCLPSTAAVPRLHLAAREDAFDEVRPKLGPLCARPVLPSNPEDLLVRVNQLLSMAAPDPGEMAGQDAA